MKVSDLLPPCKGSGTLIFRPDRHARICFVYNEWKMVGGLFWSHICVNHENFEVCLGAKPVWLWWDPHSWCFCKRCVRGMCCWTRDQNHLLQIAASPLPFPFQHVIMYTSTYQKGAEAAADILLSFYSKWTNSDFSGVARCELMGRWELPL